jgi:hypothetical protein
MHVVYQHTLVIDGNRTSLLLIHCSCDAPELGFHINRTPSDTYSPDPAFPIVVDPPSPRGFSTVAPVRTLRRAVLVDRSAYLGALRSLSSRKSPLHVRISPTPVVFP